MQIVIDIPEEDYRWIKKQIGVTDYQITQMLYNRVRKSTPLLKRTIDADELLKRIAEKCKTPSLSENTINGLCGATAIIYDMLIESEVDNADSN